MDAPVRRVGVIGTGAMGGGAVQSLVRAGFVTLARDIRAEAQESAVRHGAIPTATPAHLASATDAVIVLVDDAEQVETVLFGVDGVTSAGPSAGIVLVSSTVDPAYVGELAPRLAARGIALLDAPGRSSSCRVVSQNFDRPVDAPTGLRPCERQALDEARPP